MIESLGKNRYRFIVNVGSGKGRKRRTKTVVHKGGKKELQRMYERFEDECKNKPLADLTLGDIIELKIEHGKSLNLKAHTIRGYKACQKRFTDDYKRLKAQKVSTYHIEKIIAQMTADGLASKTIRNTIGFLSAAYEHAIAIGQVTENPCKRATLPKGKSRDIRILYQNEIQPFLLALAEEPLDDKVAYELALFLGLRRSEILGLKESDIDLNRRLIFIHNTRHRVEAKNIEQDTKTVKSTRILALPDILVTDIYLLMQLHKSLPFQHTDYLIQNGVGEIITPQALASRLNRFEKRKGLPHVTLHGLRHTYASLLHSQGVDMAMISAELGHSNLSTTMNIYTHIFDSASNASKQIADTINNFLPHSCHISENKKR